LPIVTIDGETARDFDDAVYVEPLANGNWQLQVHIADVSHYVRPGTSLDLEARLRGTSVYFPDRAIPMLPNDLSSGMCSLRPDEDRLVQSCLMEIDARGEIVGFEVCEGMIRSARRMTYTQVQAILDRDEKTREEFSSLVREFEQMYELALKLNAKRKRRGSIDFDLPEPVVQFDPQGNMQAIVRSERGWSHRLIEEFMLSANECVAHWIEANGIPGIYRVHETPDPKRIVEFEETAAQFGYTLGFSNLPVKRVTTRGDRRDASNSGRTAQTHEIPDAIPVTPQMYPTDGEDPRQAGGAYSLVPDAAIAQAGALCGEERRPLRTGLTQLHTLHFADPALPGSDRASPVPLPSTRRSQPARFRHSKHRAAALGRESDQSLVAGPKSGAGRPFARQRARRHRYRV